MNGSDVISISRSGKFTLEQAQQLLPVIGNITEKYSEVVEALIARLEALNTDQQALIDSLEEQTNQKIQDWHLKIRKLGAIPKGLWLVDFDAGDGYFCWKYPERQVLYWHSYKEGYANRVPLAEKPPAIQDQGRLFNERQ